MQLNDVRALFPEITSRSELRGFLTRISGTLVEESAAVVDRTDELTALGALCTEPVQDGPAMFDAFARAFCGEHRARVEQEFARSPLTTAAAGTLTDEFLAWLTERVQQAGVRTLVVVLDLLRRAGALPGDTSDERLRQFCALSARPEFRTTLFAVFPELGRQVTALADNAVGHVRRMVRETTAAVADGRLPSAGTGGGRPRITSIGYGLGDTHAGGQAVCRLTFDTGRVLVYKPRPMSVERAYADLVTRINAAGGFALPVLDVWCGDDCGWQEYADQAPAGPAPDYFRCAGQLLGVLHLLRASDMHHENVLNHRGRPVVVDAESLFSVNRRAGDGREQSAEIQDLANTVFSTGFLPTRIADPAGGERSIDIGFLGYVPGQRAVTSSPVLDGFGTDRPQVRLEAGSVDTPTVRPATASRGYELQQLCRGFAELYDWACERVDDLDSWLRDLFGDIAIRSVLEATSKYYQLLQTASHPTFQQSTPLKELLLHRVGMGRLDHVTTPVVRAEIRDLLQGDVPYFTLRTGTTWLYHDREPIADVLLRTPLAQTLAELRTMSPVNRDRNVRVIRAAYADLTEPECDAPSYTWRTARRAAVRRRPAVDRTRPVVAAIAGELHRFVIGTTRPGWVGATIRDTRHEFPWRVGGLGDDLYAGVAGVALFLGAAGVLLDDARHRALAQDALRCRVEALLADPARRRREASGGMAGGYPGLAFAAVEVGHLTGADDLAELGAALWSRVPDDLDLVSEADFLMGSAGLLAAALTVDEDRLPGSAAVTEAAYRHLRTRLTSDVTGQRVYSGFAHGTSGTLAALARYHRVTGGATAELAGVRTVHEGLHNDEAGHWPISNLAPERVARGWCHGTPGVLLGVTERLAAGVLPSGHPYSAAGQLADDVAGAGFGLNLSLCHGDLGNLVILHQAAAWDTSGRTAERVADRRAELCARTVPGMLRSRVGKSVLTDSLYVGLAGIGLGLTILSGEVPVASPLTFRRDVRSPR